MPKKKEFSMDVRIGDAQRRYDQNMSEFYGMLKFIGLATAIGVGLYFGLKESGLDEVISNMIQEFKKNPPMPGSYNPSQDMALIKAYGQDYLDTARQTLQSTLQSKLYL
jgi:hypothetical protein